MTEEIEAPEAERGNERMLRDMERWKERVEVSLDNRQVFFLFFGAAVAACLVFVLGVMVGKRLEARARDQAVPMRSDPLAVLDQVGEEGEETAPRGAGGAAQTVSTPPAPGAGPSGATPALPSAATKADASPTSGKESRQKETKEAKEPKAAREAKEAKEVKEVKPAKESPQEKDPGKESKEETEGAGAGAESAAGTASAEAGKENARYTLQLSAFQERAEAEEFAKKLASSGYKLNIVAADIPGRGVWYRVRLGEFSSQRQALEAKAEFEKKHHVIAYVMKL